MDRITKGMLDEFIAENSLNSLKEDTAFEHFTGYLITSQHYTESFSSSDICVGSGADTGIDDIAIIVNGSLVNDVEEISDLIEVNGFLDATFIFVQSERSSSFDMQKIGQFGFGVFDFFQETPSLKHNSDLEIKLKIVNEIYSNSSKFKKGNPRVFLCYATTGKWVGDSNLVARKDSVIKDLESLTIFKEVSFECIGADQIQVLYRNSKNAISVEINFPNKTALPDFLNVQQAYIGYLNAIEYLKLIQNDNNEIISSLFYDNVRHWQAWNDVNKEIKKTLLNEEQQIYFPLFNNGITIIAKSINSTGNKLTLEDYQIVNGCQTSHVLHELSDKLNDTINIPVRIVATTNPDIKNAIIKATNRQTEVTDDQLIALSDYPRKLEDFFPSYDTNHKLYYERRSKQYESVQGVEKVRVISMPNLIRSFASIFLELPHSTTRNYKSLLKLLGTKIFKVDHKLDMYYLAGYAFYRIEYLFRSQFIESKLKPARFHILLALRLLISKEKLPRYNSNDMEKYCHKIIVVLFDENQYRQYFYKAVDIINQVADGNYHRDNIRTESFTKGVLNKIKNIQV